MSRVMNWIGKTICDFGIWFSDKTLWLARDHNDLEEAAHDRRKMEEMRKSFEVTV